jgi:hypothetical protein
MSPCRRRSRLSGRGAAVADVRGGDRDDQERAEGVGHDMSFAARHLLPAVVAA